MQVDIALHQLPRRRGDRGQAIHQVKGYVDQHWDRIQYERFRQEGRPIGSGTAESGAKNVVQWRMKRGGQSWSRPGATRMLAALGELHSKRWSDTAKTRKGCLSKLPRKLLRNHTCGESGFEMEPQSLGLTLEAGHLALTVFGVVLLDSDVPIGCLVL